MKHTGLNTNKTNETMTCRWSEAEKGVVRERNRKHGKKGKQNTREQQDEKTPIKHTHNETEMIGPRHRV